MKTKGKKKLFSLVNLVGLGVFFLVLATAVFFFLRRSAYATIVLRASQGNALEVWYGLPMWYLESLKPGMVQKDIFGRPVITITKSFYYPSNVNYQVEYLTLKLLTTYDRKSGIYSYEGIPLLIGSYQTFKIKGVMLRGIIHRIEDGNWQPEKKEYIVEGFLNPVKTENQDPYEAETMTSGVLNYLADKFTKGLKSYDSDGSTIMEILDVRKEPAYRKFIYQNRLVETIDNDRKNVKLKLRVTTEKYGDIYLYRGDSSLRINDNLYLDFWNFGAQMIVTSVSES